MGANLGGFGLFSGCLPMFFRFPWNILSLCHYFLVSYLSVFICFSVHPCLSVFICVMRVEHTEDGERSVELIHLDHPWWLGS